LLAEACLRHLGRDKFRAFSCGVPSYCDGKPSNWVFTTLQSAGIPSAKLDCKDWSEFTRNGSARMDFVIALDAQTAHKQPSWPGQPETALRAYPRLTAAKGYSADLAVATLQTLPRCDDALSCW